MFDTPSSPFSTIRRLRCASSTFNITYLANRSSCRSCLRRCCTSTSLQSFLRSCRRVKSTALSSIRKLSPGSVVPPRIVAEPSHILFDGFDVNRHFASVPGARWDRVVPVVLNSFRLFSSTWSNFLGRWYEVLLKRTSLSIRPRRFARLHDLSTMSNSIDQPYVNNVELHRPTVYQQCRTPSAVALYVKPSNVELHRQVVSPSQWCLHQQCRTQTRRIE